MEIQRDNLFTVTLDTLRLSDNFTYIDTTLKKIQSQLYELTSQHQIVSQSLNNQGLQINKIDQKLKKNTQILSKHALLMQQFQLQPNSEAEFKEQECDYSSRNPVADVNGERVITETNENKEVKNEDEEVNRKRKITEQKGKTHPEKGISNLKERLLALQRQKDEQQLEINEIFGLIQKYKPRQSHSNLKRMSDISKRNSKKSRGEDKERPSLVIPQTQLNSLSQQSITRSEFKQFSEHSLSIENMEKQKNEPFNKELINLKNTLLQKMKILEAQYKESQHRAQAVEKNVDLLQRSHQMLKYDFDRTSTSWSKNRTANTQDTKTRGQKSSLCDTRLTRQGIEEKLLELFNQMDLIRKEYDDLQRQLNRQEGIELQPSNTKTRSNSKEKQQNHKLISTIKMDTQQKKQIAFLKRQLAKVREDFDEFACGVNTNTSELKTVVIKPNQNKEDWKILSTKMYKLKMELQSGLRDMESKIATNNDMVVLLNGLEVSIEECRLLLKRKVQYTDYQKGLKRVQNRLNNFITQIYQKEGREQQIDAALAKQPWFCLSCDNQFKNYTAKTSKSPPKQKLAGRKVNPQSHMIRRNENGRFPSVLK